MRRSLLFFCTLLFLIIMCTLNETSVDQDTGVAKVDIVAEDGTERRREDLPGHDGNSAEKRNTSGMSEEVGKQAH